MSTKEAKSMITYEEAYNLYRVTWKKKLAKGNRALPAKSRQPKKITKSEQTRYSA